MEILQANIVVAGGAGNLGRAIVATLHARGARVGVLDLAPPTDAADVACYAQADAGNDAAAGAAIGLLWERLGPIRVLVNCLGTIHSEPLVTLLDARGRHRVETWDAVIRSNLTAPFLLASHVAERMARARIKGVIVNFSSIAAAGNAGQSAYAAAKAGLEALTTVWARELGPLGIRAVAIAPGFVDTPSTVAAMAESALQERVRQTPLRRLARPAEIASAVVFAIENDYLTGRTIAIDGGLAR